jgi:hypothetical protein
VLGWEEILAKLKRKLPPTYLSRTRLCLLLMEDASSRVQANIRRRLNLSFDEALILLRRGNNFRLLKVFEALILEL